MSMSARIPSQRNRLAPRCGAGALRPLLLAALLPLAACSADGPRVQIADATYTVEIADDPDEQRQGLMFRDTMPRDHGMLFIFDQERQRSFWMKNTRIPLDIIYFDAERRLVSVAENARPCRTRRCPGYPSEGPAQYVLELNAGEADRLGLERGDPFQLRGLPQRP